MQEKHCLGCTNLQYNYYLYHSYGLYILIIKELKKRLLYSIIIRCQEK